jgi:hypothetical protein
MGASAIMSIPNPYKNPDAYGQVTIGGSVLPGILTALGLPARAYEFAVQQGYGATQVTIYRTTKILDTIEVVQFLRSPNPDRPNERDDFDTLRDVFMPLLIPGWPNKITGKPRAFPFVHPDAQWLGLKKSHLTAFEHPKMMTPGDPSRSYKLVFQEDMPQTRIPTGPPEPAKINGPPAPTTVNEATLLKLLADFKGT